MPFSKYTSHRVLSPSISQIGGHYYLAFEGRNKNTSSIFIATSSNLLNWKTDYNPIIQGDNKNQYYSPSILSDKENKHILLYYCNKIDGKSFIRLNKYSDISFKQLISNRIVLKQTNKYEAYSIYAPFVIKKMDSYLMFYSGWSLNPIMGRIMSAVSENGFDWKKNTKPFVEPSIVYDIKHCSEPAIIDVNNKTYLIYEGCNSTDNWRILKKEILKNYDWNY